MQTITRKTGPSSERRSSLFIRMGRHKMHYLMLAPAMLLLLLFSYRPMLGIVIAFKDYFPGRDMWSCEWVGLANFEFMKYREFANAMGNTLAITALKLVFGFPAPILLALMFNEVQNARFKKITQSIAYLPHFMSWIVVAYILEALLSPSVGLVNQVIASMGGTRITFLAKSEYFRAIITLSSVWKEVGWGTIIYLAAITSIDLSLYEAAEVEGASKLQQIRHITLPCIMPTISVLLVLNIPNILNAGMDQILPLMNNANLSVSDVLDTYIMRNGLQQGNYSVSTAAGLMSSVVKLLLLLLTNNVSKRLGGDGIF